MVCLEFKTVTAWWNDTKNHLIGTKPAPIKAFSIETFPIPNYLFEKLLLDKFPFLMSLSPLSYYQGNLTYLAPFQHSTMYTGIPSDCKITYGCSMTIEIYDLRTYTHNIDIMLTNMGLTCKLEMLSFQVRNKKECQLSCQLTSGCNFWVFGTKRERNFRLQVTLNRGQ